MNVRIPFVVAMLVVVGCVAGAVFAEKEAKKIKVLLVDGQNNHAWKETTPVLVSILEKTGRFEVDVCTSPAGPPKAPRKPKTDDAKKLEEWKAALKKHIEDGEALKVENKAKWAAWRPAFSDYDVVLSNYNGEMWPEEVQTAFEEYVKGGGGFVAVHAADNSFPQWKAYNRMIALGGWGGRNEASGPYLRLRDGEFVQDTTPGKGGSHGPRREFVVETRAPDHAVMKKLPPKWMHALDELYDRLRGPAEDVTVMATGFADPEFGGSGEHEPLLMGIAFGDGRVFHTTLGHDTVSMSGVGFRETLARGTEWAATGGVSFGEVTAEELPLDKAAVVE